MQIYLDDEPIATTATNLRAGIDEARREAESRQRVIVDVLVDDERLTDADLASVFAEDGSSSGPDLGHDDADRTLRCRSVTPLALVADVLAGARTTLDEIAETSRTAAEAVQAGRTSEALSDLEAVLARWEQVRVAITEGMAFIGIDVERLGDDAPEIPTAVAALTTHLRDLHAALSAEDWSALADGLGYESETLVESWRQLLDALHHRLSEADAVGR